MNPIRIYLADDHQIVIDGLTLLLKGEPGFTIVGTSLNGQSALNDIIKLKPDVALIDLRMPDKDGLQIARALKEKSETRVIILSMHADRRYINDAINYGADAYILKNAGKEELLRTINGVMKGAKSFPPITKHADETGREVFLTPRELDIFRLVINEFTSAQIAEKFSLSQFTVDTHRKNILKKTGAKSVAGLMKYAVEHNISLTE